MRTNLLLITMFISTALFAQVNIPVAESFSIEGKVKKEISVSLTDFSAYKSYSIDSIVILNHAGEKRSTLKSKRSLIKGHTRQDGNRFRKPKAV